MADPRISSPLYIGLLNMTTKILRIAHWKRQNGSKIKAYTYPVSRQQSLLIKWAAYHWIMFKRLMRAEKHIARLPEQQKIQT